ncbi:hypothetical protein DY000_02059082 [Brassica cretica]|uniref:Uncharacterized protein n=1 Tax=Brassica cretica TaxID=69181 RepID=A0ABQ7AST3_BRACR|nr:hypothetical protein DY000_02059082 [Brassica cretica]
MALYNLLRPTFGITTVMNTAAPTRGLYKYDIGRLQERDGHRYHPSSVSDPITVSFGLRLARRQGFIYRRRRRYTLRATVGQHCLFHYLRVKVYREMFQIALILA